MKTLYRYLLPLLLVLISCSCKKFLEAKSDQALYVPATLRDCQALLDDYVKMNTNYPAIGEGTSDDYYLTDAHWLALSDENDRNNYIWAAGGLHALAEWQRPYSVIFNTNLVLQTLVGINPTGGQEYNSIKGAALFFRGYNLFMVASLFCAPYDANTAAEEPGVPIWLKANIDESPGRGTVQQTYDQIIQDLKEAVELMPETSTHKARPNKVAACAVLARVYLAMRDYSNAEIYANLCLNSYNTLLDYASLNAAANVPFTRFNDEVIFASAMVALPYLNLAIAKIPEALYNSYHTDDIRKTIFFRLVPAAGTYAFKGSYDALPNNRFNGLATDEIYLIRAECLARAGNIAAALQDLNDLLRKRWKKDSFGNSLYTNYTAATADQALEIILKERRKELIHRGLRWTDLRRLNKESRFAVTLSRTVSGQTYTLPPNDLRYTLLIPREVIEVTGMAQNKR